MSAKTVTVDLGKYGIDKIHKEIDEYLLWLETSAEKFCHELAKEGVSIASVEFSNAEYDGTNDVSVKYEIKNDKEYLVVATGNATLFIEFGAGVFNPDGHPEQMYERGTYGRGKGKNKSWTYYGDTGTNGVAIRDSVKGQVVRTRGNPSQMCMYKTVRQIEERFEEIARRCFQ